VEQDCRFRLLLGGTVLVAEPPFSGAMVLLNVDHSRPGTFEEFYGIVSLQAVHLETWLPSISNSSIDSPHGSA